MVIPRPDPPGTLAEREMALAYLDYHRQTLARKIDGLTGEQAISRSTVSGLTLLGLVRHLTEVERGWIAEDFLGSGPTAALQPAGRSGRRLRRARRRPAARPIWRPGGPRSPAPTQLSRSHSLDETVQHERMGEISLRWILWHLFEEYARHNGHADIIREAIDGEVGE